MIKICIPVNMANIMLPCYNPYKMKYYKNRFLSEAATGYSCKGGHIPLVSANALHQLHILLFFLAVFHVIYSAIIMFLGRLKIRGWKAWEAEASSYRYEFVDEYAFQLTFFVDIVLFWDDQLFKFVLQTFNNQRNFRGWEVVPLQLHHSSTTCSFYSDGFNNEKINI